MTMNPSCLELFDSWSADSVMQYQSFCVGLKLCSGVVYEVGFFTVQDAHVNRTVIS